ncbi:radical SAM protein [Cuniculiplasma sp. SKW4]|uniref:radical SAM protein n=1 Tax=Cuniculiplasma sp. SKW4 TaxID=3400171 RepID=UPI003FD3ADC2
MNLIILPTEKCNFRCIYCYEDFNIGLMKPEVEEGIKNLLKVRGPELRSLQIGWFGGEPLLEFQIIESIMSYILESMPKSPYINIMSNITTNGFQLDKRIFDR